MLRTIGDTVLTLVRNWKLIIALTMTGGFAMLFAAEREWMNCVGASLAAAGIGANLFVMVINGGRMPVRTANELWLETAIDHRLMHDDTRLAFLGDWIPVRCWVVSPGDIILSSGMAVFAVGRLFLS